MENLSLWCKLVSCFSVISALFALLIPENSLKKAFNTLITLILVFILIHPLDGKNYDYILRFDGFSAEETEVQNSDISTVRNEMLLGTVKGEAETYLNEIMSSCGIDCTCSVVCDFKGEEICITAVEINGDVRSGNETVIYNKVQEISESKIDVIINGELYE